MLPFPLEQQCQHNLQALVGSTVTAASSFPTSPARLLLVHLAKRAGTLPVPGDLGAESINFLDIVFYVERAFSVKIPRGELFLESVFQGDPDFVRDGRVTEQGMAELRSWMPYAGLSAFDQDRRLTAVPNLFTVGLVARYVAWKLGQCAGVAPNGSGGTGAISAT